MAVSDVSNLSHFTFRLNTSHVAHCISSSLFLKRVAPSSNLNSKGWCAVEGLGASVLCPLGVSWQEQFQLRALAGQRCQWLWGCILLFSSSFLRTKEFCCVLSNGSWLNLPAGCWLLLDMLEGWNQITGWQFIGIFWCSAFVTWFHKLTGSTGTWVTFSGSTISLLPYTHILCALDNQIS